MCGEIEAWQKAETFSIRVTSGGLQNIVLPKQFANVEEIRLDEYMVVNFNGGVSGSTYLNMRLNGFSPAYVNSNGRPGVLLGVDVLNPHVVYSRPRTMFRAPMVALHQFELSLANSAGAVSTFDEAIFFFTVVMRKPAEELQETREMMRMVEFPSRVDPGRNYFNPQGTVGY
jgi:hypothetical protein